MEVTVALQEAFETLPEVVPAELDRFRRHSDPAWVEEALVATGTATVRRRRLPAEEVLWLVIGMALMRNESLERVVEWLGLAPPDGRGGPGCQRRDHPGPTASRRGPGRVSVRRHGCSLGDRKRSAPPVARPVVVWSG